MGIFFVHYGGLVSILLCEAFCYWTLNCFFEVFEVEFWLLTF